MTIIEASVLSFCVGVLVTGVALHEVRKMGLRYLTEAHTAYEEAIATHARIHEMFKNHEPTEE